MAKRKKNRKKGPQMPEELRELVGQCTDFLARGRLDPQQKFVIRDPEGGVMLETTGAELMEDMKDLIAMAAAVDANDPEARAYVLRKMGFLP